ncbi:MAG: HNH endonuclease [Bryobacterales bacterium]|nr:HNH endonuclease [Bryobacteraceae bacterium]MDW8129822.1 HNH endonuclease [Bryobacterales bacterium]
MPVSRLMQFIRRAKPLTIEEGVNILKRDHYRCQYCGLDGSTSFENYLVMTVDFVVPRARGGKKEPRNLVTACRPCNLIKGRHVFKSFEEAKEYVLKRREELRQEWQKRMSRLKAHKTGA